MVVLTVYAGEVDVVVDVLLRPGDVEAGLFRGRRVRRKGPK